VSRQAKAPSADPDQRRVTRLGRVGVSCLVVLGLAAFLGIGAPAASAVDNCPNAIFRTGFSAKLPDCRAFEVVTPYTGGKIPLPTPMFEFAGLDTEQFGSMPNSADGNSYLFGSQSTLPGFNGTPWINEYQARRTASGWQTTLVGPTGAQAANMWSGGHSLDGNFAFMRALGDPTYTLAPQINNSGSQGEASYLRGPDGSLQLLGEGTLPASPDEDGFENGKADEPAVQGRYISPGADHVIFQSERLSGTPVQLLPDAPTAARAVYDRTPQGLKLISLLPGDVTPSTASSYMGASADGSTVLFANGPQLYARVGDQSTTEIANAEGLPAGARLSCTPGPASAANKDFQWLRNGAPIAGATDSTYKTQAADEGKVVQCEVFALNANAGSVDVSAPFAGLEIVAPVPATRPPETPNGSHQTIPAPSPSATLTVGGAGGQTLTCNTGSWLGSPTFTYQWYRNGVALSGNGADTETYTVQEADLSTPAVFQCSITGTNAGGASVRFSASQATSPEPSSPSAPVATAATYFPDVATPAGVTEDGSTVLYVQEGNIFSVDAATGDKTLLVDAGDAQVVNVSDDLSHIFFVSRRQLDGGKGTLGQPNVYVWSAAGGTQFITTVLESELYTPTGGGKTELQRFALWTASPSENLTQPAVLAGRWSEQGGRATRPITNRVTPDGSVFAFETKAQVGTYNNNGKPEVYRYEVATDSLTCVSCDPSGNPPNHGAQLVLLGDEANEVMHNSIIENLSEDGKTLFFETRDGLLNSDFDGKKDVYEWHNGTLSLIGNGNSVGDEEIVGATSDASTVFIRSRDPLVEGLPDPGTPAIFAARVDGGFPPAESAVTEPCVADACQGAPSAVPTTPGAASAELHGQGNVETGKDCSSVSARLRKLSARVDRLRAQARKAGSPQRARKLRQQAAKLAKKEPRQSARRCKSRKGGTSR
jgi:hypothetical protein